MRGRRSQLTDKARQRLDREVEIISQHTPYKTLAAELRLTEQYVRNYISATLRKRILIKRTNAPNTDG